MKNSLTHKTRKNNRYRKHIELQLRLQWMRKTMVLNKFMGNVQLHLRVRLFAHCTHSYVYALHSSTPRFAHAFQWIAWGKVLFNRYTRMFDVKCVWAWRIHEHSSAEINKGNIWKSTLAHTDSLMIPMHFHWIALFRWSLIYAHNFATAAFNINQCLRMQHFVQTYKHIHMLCFHF